MRDFEDVSADLADMIAECPAHVTAPSGQRCNEGSERQEEK